MDRDMLEMIQGIVEAHIDNLEFELSRPYILTEEAIDYTMQLQEAQVAVELINRKLKELEDG